MEKRSGFTTGSCAAAAAKAACYMLLSGKEKTGISIITPKGVVFDAKITDTDIKESYVTCAVIKDGGDDPDVTTGAHITATVRLSDKSGIHIDGGCGVGRVTLPGLDQKIGMAAINHVPREMIEKEVTKVLELFDHKGGIDILIEVPKGEEIAQKTFNPRLGIEGGISILGTSGIVEPMSLKALLDTIRVEINQRHELGYKNLVMTPGNYGLDFMKRTYGYDLEQAVKCSNYIGDALDMAKDSGFESVLLVGHIGKLVKVSGGIMNTHSKTADCRMELLGIAAFKAGAGRETVNEILKCISTEEAVNVLIRNDILKETMDTVMERAMDHLRKRADSMHIECMMYSNEHGLLAKSENALKYLV